MKKTISLVISISFNSLLFSFTPSDLGDALWAWGWAGKNSENLTFYDSETSRKRIRHMTDLSGNENHFFNNGGPGGAPCYEPSINRSGYTSPYPAIALHKYNDGKDVFGQNFFQTTPLNAPGEFYLASVAMDSRNQGARYLLGTTAEDKLTVDQKIQQLTLTINGTNYRLTNKDSWSDGVLLIEIWRDNAGNITTYINGEDKTITGGVKCSDICRLCGTGGPGGDSGWDDYAFEYLLCDNLPSRAMRDSTREYMRKKWNIYGPDKTPPKLNDVNAYDKNRLLILFSESLDQPTAEEPLNYLIEPNVSVISAQLQPTGDRVLLTTGNHGYEIEYTLTVKNVKDFSIYENEITAPDNVFSYMVYENGSVDITNITAGSGFTYEVDSVAVGKELYIDRAYTFYDFPPKLMGCSFIRTRKDDKTDITFTAAEDITVYIAYNSFSNYPVWLQEFTATGDTIIGNYTFSVHKKNFAAGTIVLGTSTAYAMYVPIVQKNGTVKLNNPKGVQTRNLELECLQNPFDPSFNIQIKGITNKEQRTKNAEIRIYNVQGELMEILCPLFSVLSSTVTWNASHMPSGTYFLRLNTGSRILQKQIFLNR